MQGFVCSVRTCANWQHPPLQHGVEVHAGQNTRGTGSAGGCRLQSSQLFAHAPHDAHLSCADASGAAVHGRFELAAGQSHGECLHRWQLGGAAAAAFFRLHSAHGLCLPTHTTHRPFFPVMRAPGHPSASPRLSHSTPKTFSIPEDAVCGVGVPCCGCSYCFPQKFTCTVNLKLTDAEYLKSESSWWIARLRRRFRGSGTASPHFWDGFGLFCFPTLCTYTDYLLKTNDALSPAPDRFPQVSFRLRLVSFGHDHHVLRTRNRACIAWPRDFIVPASNVVLHHLKKRSRKTMFSAIKASVPPRSMRLLKIRSLEQDFIPRQPVTEQETV